MLKFLIMNSALLLVNDLIQQATMIDKADRELMHSCLRLLWNMARLSGEFVTAWKEENRVVIHKSGKDDYHECNAYRTISLTSCLGKRFES